MTTSAHKSKTPPPAGTRPPAPPWVKIAAWLVLLLCLGLAAGRGPLLRWAAAAGRAADAASHTGQEAN